MAKDDDQTDNIFDEGELEEDGTADLIRKAWNDQNEEEEADDGGFDQPMDMGKVGDEPDVVSPEQGHELVDKAEIDKEKARLKEKNAEEEAGEESDPAERDGAAAKDTKKAADDHEDDPKSDAEKDGEEEGGKDDAADLTTSTVDALLDGVPDDRKAELARRLSAADEAMAPFHTDYAKAQMQQFGAEPKQVAERLVQLAEFASTKPAEYIAWAAQESAASPDKIIDVLNEAAKFHGLKVTKAEAEDDDEDLFEDPRIAEIKRENAELKAKLNGGAPSFGPDTPERQTARQASDQLATFISEKDEAGNLKRPLFAQLQPIITERAAKMRQETGKFVTVADLEGIYSQAVAEMQSALGVTPTPPNPAPDNTSAAQGVPPVADQLKTQAAAAAKAKRASKSVDGTGQGATRRPALSDDADLDAVIRHFANQSDV